MSDKVLYCGSTRLICLVLREIGIIAPVILHSFRYVLTVTPAFGTPFKRLRDFLSRFLALRP